MSSGGSCCNTTQLQQSIMRNWATTRYSVGSSALSLEINIDVAELLQCVADMLREFFG
jgi:hypothetical protein